jgi:hypothetical protein
VPTAVVTESLPAVPARARLTTRLRERAGRLVVDGICATVVASARQHDLSWPTVMDAVREAAAPVTDAAPPPVDALGIDETRRGRPRLRTADDPAPQNTPERGEPAKARVLADRWHVGFTDLAGGQGMLGQVEGRTADDVAYWLASQSAAWRDRIRHVVIDMCTVFVAAVRRCLPHATLIVDHFHVVQLANNVVTEVRRRVITLLRGRRGRDSDPEWKIRNLLGRNREDLSERAFAKLWNTLVDLDKPGADHPGRLDRERTATRRARPGSHPPRPHRDRPPAHQVLPLVRRRRDPRTRTPRLHGQHLVALHRGIPAHRTHQRRQRGPQPDRQTRRPQRLRLPQPDQPAATNTLRKHPPSPRMPQPPITSKTQYSIDRSDYRRARRIPGQVTQAPSVVESNAVYDKRQTQKVKTVRSPLPASRSVTASLISASGLRRVTNSSSFRSPSRY